METTRMADNAAEKEIGTFLGEYLYSNQIFTRADRTSDVNSQVNGSDIIISIPSLGISDGIVDEKAASHYINKSIDTFILELSFINNSEGISEGWFLNDTLTTQYYLLQWIKAKETNPAILKKDDITEVECILVRKDKLRKYFEDEGWRKERLSKLSQDMRDWWKRGGKTLVRPEGKPFKFLLSYKYKEQPVVIILDKEIYSRLSDFHFNVSNKGILDELNSL